MGLASSPTLHRLFGGSVLLLLSSVRVVISCAGLWWLELIPLCLAVFVGHPVGVCGAVSSAGGFWPARLLSLRLGGGEVSADGGMGKVAGGSRGRVGRVPEEQPSAAGLGWVAQEWSIAGLFVGLSDGGGKCGVRKSSFLLADLFWVP